MTLLLVLTILLAQATSEALPPITDELWSDDGYAITIDGTNPTVTIWQSILAKAQAIQPPSALVADLPWPGGGCEGIDLAAFQGSHRWWTYCDSPFPVAITVNSDVVQHYRTAIRALAESRETDDVQWTYAKLEYMPRVSHAPNYAVGSTVFEDVHIARLRLNLSYGGGGCHTDIRMERILVYGKDEELLAITGDGIITPNIVCY